MFRNPQKPTNFRPQISVGMDCMRRRNQPIRNQKSGRGIFFPGSPKDPDHAAFWRRDALGDHGGAAPVPVAGGLLPRDGGGRHRRSSRRHRRPGPSRGPLWVEWEEGGDPTDGNTTGRSGTQMLTVISAVQSWTLNPAGHPIKPPGCILRRTPPTALVTGRRRHTQGLCGGPGGDSLRSLRSGSWPRGSSSKGGNLDGHSRIRSLT